MKKIIALVLAVAMVLAITCSASATTSVHQERNTDTYVYVKVTNLTTGKAATERMLAGTWYIYADGTYGGANDAYPISAGTSGLYFNYTYISRGGYRNGNPTESTTSESDAYGNKIRINLNYSAPVGVAYANYASKTNDKTLRENYAYGPTDNAKQPIVLIFTFSFAKR